MREENVTTELDWTDGGRRPPITSRDAYKRGEIDDNGRPSIDGERVDVNTYEAFRKAWVAFYDASACPTPNCDGEAGHSLVCDTCGRRQPPRAADYCDYCGWVEPDRHLGTCPHNHGANSEDNADG